MADPAPIHGGDVLAAAARWGLDPSEILDFSANINPFGPPRGVTKAARDALRSVARYPEPLARTLRAALALRHGVPEEAVLVGSGAAEVIHLLARLAAGRRVAVPVPGFAEYARAARAVGAVVVPTPVGGAFATIPAAETGGAAPAEPTPALEAGDLRFLCNPHNPTGRLLPPGDILRVADGTPATVVVDEAFIDLTDPGEDASVLRHVMERPNLVAVRSLTKFFAMPGLRVGYAVARPDLVSRLDAVRDPWSVSAPAQAAALAALADQAYARRTREWVRRERSYLAGELAGLPGFAIEPPSANFILVRAPEPVWSIQNRLGPRGILVRDCRSFDGLTERHMRVAVRSRAENRRLAEALSSSGTRSAP